MHHGALSIQYPVAEQAGRLVWADNLAADGQRPDDATCPGCGGRVVLRSGAVRRPHFAHHTDDGCAAPETALHAATCRALAGTLEDAAATGRRYPMTVSCQICIATRETDLAAYDDLNVLMDQVLADGIRPDLLVRSGERPLYIIEVAVTHAPDSPALDLYASRDLPVLVVRPTWEALPQLRHGLGIDLPPAPDGKPPYEVASRCRFPRHVEEGTVPCGTCERPARHLTAEVSTTPCWRSNCNADVRVLDLYDHRTGSPVLVTASCPDLPDLTLLARDLQVNLRWARSRQAGGSYLMHTCGRCRATQGDNFIYTADGASPALGEHVRHLTACPAGHLQLLRAYRWPSRSRAARPHAELGIVGERPGLFDDRSASVRLTAVGTNNVHAAINRMLGAGPF